jgi:predicted PurR-regulated permease PerM
MAQNASATAPSKFLTLASVCIVIGALYVARDVLLPLSLAVLLTFLLAPMVRRLERLRVPRVPAVLLVVVLSFAVISGIGWLISSQTTQLIGKLTEYRSDIESKIEDIQHRFGHGALAQGFQAASQVVRDVASSQPTELTHASPGTMENPMAVTIIGTQTTPETALNALGNALSLVIPLAQSLAVIVFVIFMLIQKEDLRDRLIRLIGHGQLTVTTQALDDAATRVSRYLLAQSLLNGCYGIVIGFGLFILRVPNAPLWGGLCALLRFIPYLGIWIGAIFPIVLSFVVPEGYYAARPILTICLFGGAELTAANFIEPFFFGTRTGVSPLAILVAAVFWTWLWGPVGLLLSTPMAVILAVAGKYVPQMRFLDVILSDQPVLEPFERYYQRLLADDPEQAEDLLREFEKSRTLLETYSEILLPALQYSEREYRRGLLDDERRETIRKMMREHIDLRADELSKTPAETQNHLFVLPKGAVVNVVCLPANDEADEIAADMLAHLLRALGYSAQAIACSALASEMVEVVAEKNADIVVISALPPDARTHARYLCKRLLIKLPELRILVGLWTVENNGKSKQSFYGGPNTRVTTSFADALPVILQMVQPAVMREKDQAKVNT